MLHVDPDGASTAAGGDKICGIAGASPARPAEALEGEGGPPPRMAPFADFDFGGCVDGGGEG